MKQLIQNLRTGSLTAEDVPYPLCGRGDVVVRTACSVISAGTERSIIDLAKKSLLGKAKARPDLFKRAWDKASKEGFMKVFEESMNRLDEPFPLGYSASGIVVEAGQEVTEFRVGDRVAIAGSGYANHAEYNVVPMNLCMHMPARPDGGPISSEEAAFCMLGGIALQGIRDADLTFGERVTVVGLGVLGLLTVQILNAVGCEVIGVDIDADKCHLAQKLGCRAIYGSTEDVTSRYEDAVDAVLICAAARDSSPLDLAQKIARQRGRIVLVGVCETKLERKYFWDKELEFRVSKAAGPGILDENYENRGIDYPIGYVRWPEKRNMEYFLSLVAQNKVDVRSLITHRYPIEQAISGYNMILEGKEPYVSVVLEYPQPDSTEVDVGSLRTVVKRHRDDGTGPADVRYRIGLIGAGAFTRNVFLPILKKAAGIKLVGVATSRGVTSNHVATKYGFDYATSDYRKLLDDPMIGGVFIVTRHDLHAKMVIEALKAGKHVFVEKPLCICCEELTEIEEAFEASQSTLMVGFNRRYSPHALDIRDFFGEPTGSYVINCRVNAGYIEYDHWTQDPEVGGGRIIGEACHFVDFLQYVTGSRPVKVYVEPIESTSRFQGQDNMVATLRFADGSVGTLTYTSQGTKAYPREVFEIFQGDRVYYLEDFRTSIRVQGSKRGKLKFSSQRMGYDAEIKHFLDGLHNGENTRADFLTMETVFAMTESLKAGQPLTLGGAI